jgi:phosphoesterase RecJ-like protein
VDGDCLGSSFALFLALKKAGKKVSVVLEERIPKTFNFLPGEYLLLDELSQDTVFDIVICIDSSDEKRINKRLFLLEGGKSINIDHHISNTEYAMYNYVDASCSATGEIVFDIINYLKIPINIDIAINLYTAIASDTGGFRYSNTTANTHIVAASLISVGINIAKVNRIIFDTISIFKLKLISEAIDNLELYENGKIAVIALGRDMIENAGALEEDMDGLSSFPRSVEGVEVGIILTERENGKIRISFRSNEYIDVAKVAMKFGGGGHKRAGGCTLETDMLTAKKEVIGAVISEIKGDNG